MSTKHTPKPWRRDPDNNNVYANGLLAQVYGHLHNGERVANSNLIAAAPDMLECLMAHLGLLEELLPNLNKFSELLGVPPINASVILEATKLVIEKAEGWEKT